jgi:serine protease Do
VILLTALIGLGGAGTESRAQYARRTPIVEAVEKTRAGIVTVKVEKKGNWGRNKESVGTGVLVDDRGYVLTNQHVVTSATTVQVQLSDGTELSAKVVAEDARCDLAILRIQPKKLLTALPLGPGSDLLVGEEVIAIGHPFGYTNTVSTGIISALGREITMPTDEKLTNLIQTTASINPGNSGGPLLNINGEVIGINVALREGAQGIAFAINAETVKQWLSLHLSAVKVAGVAHGLKCGETVQPEGRHRQRVVVEAVPKDVSDENTGLRRGDEIVRIADRPVTNRFDLERALWDHKPGEQVPVTVVREGRELLVALTLSRRMDDKRVADSPRDKTPLPGGKTRPTGSPTGNR